jgi:hypothetical protein
LRPPKDPWTPDLRRIALHPEARAPSIEARRFAPHTSGMTALASKDAMRRVRGIHPGNPIAPDAASVFLLLRPGILRRNNRQGKGRVCPAEPCVRGRDLAS